MGFFVTISEAFGRLLSLIDFFASIATLPANIPYGLAKKHLPSWSTFSSGQAWWHALFIFVFWVGLYLLIYFLTRWYVRGQVDMFIRRAWYSHEFKIFSGLVKPCALIAVYGPFMVWYMRLPQLLLWACAGCGVAVLVYDIVKARLGAPFILLQQLYLAVLTGVYWMIFVPILLVYCLLCIIPLGFCVRLRDVFSPKLVTTTYFGEDGILCSENKNGYM